VVEGDVAIGRGIARCVLGLLSGEVEFVGVVGKAIIEGVTEGLRDSLLETLGFFDFCERKRKQEGQTMQ